MGFGLGLPGLRISTRGVRVGPRFASVRVGRGGVGASVGPRIARVSVGRGGLTVGSGLGPLSMSNRGVGVSVGAGLGGVQVGTQGLSGFVGPGPFWLSARVGGGGSGPAGSHGGHGASQPNGTNRAASGALPRSLQDLGADYASYRKQLEDAGAKRRNRFEMRTAAGIALFWYAAALHYPLIPFTNITPPRLPSLPSNREFRSAAKSRLKDRCELKLFMRGKQVVISNEIEQLRKEVVADRQRLQRSVKLAGKRFLQLDPKTTKAVYDAALAFSPHHATWAGIHDGTAVVVITFGDRTSMIWPEEVSLNDNGNFTAKKRLKADAIQAHQYLLVRSVLGTAKHVLRTHQNIERVRVIAVDQHGPPLVINRQVWAQAIVSRKELGGFPDTPRLISELQEFESLWIRMDGVVQDEDEIAFFSPLIDLIAKLDREDSSLLGRAGHLVHMIGHKTTGELSMLGTLSTFLADDKEVLDLVQKLRLKSRAPSAVLTDVYFWEQLGH